MNLCCLLHVSLGFGIKSTWIVIIKNFSWLPPRISHLFSQWQTVHFLWWWKVTGKGRACIPGGTFYTWAVFGLDFTSFLLICCKAGILPSMFVVTCLFFFIQEQVRNALHVSHAYFLFKFLHICIVVNGCRLGWVDSSAKVDSRDLFVLEWAM